MKPDGGRTVPKPEYKAQLRPEDLVDGNLSIAVFGPGEGEAIVVQLPDGSVGVVDGCREPKPPDNPKGRGDPVRELLDAIAAKMVAPTDFRLAFVCLTHPHDDHYGGLGRLLDAYRERIDHVWTISYMTLGHKDALEKWFAQGWRKPAPDDAKFYGLTRVIDQFHKAHTLHGSTLNHLSAGMPLLSIDMPQGRFTITACGPSAADLERAQLELGAYTLTEKGKHIGATPSYDPNRTSGALLLRWSRSAVLLAGDLLNGATQNSGWQHARRHVDCEVHVVNAAHHASEGAHDKDLWDRMRPSLAIVTPFKHGTRSNPPRPEQIAALARSSVVTITSPPDWVGRTGCPAPMNPKQPRRFDPKNSALPLTPTNQADAIRNAVAISMDASGKIIRFVLAGDADVYIAPEEVSVPIP